MSSYIHHELTLFFQSFFLGVLFLLCYDCLIVLRRVFPHRPAAVAAGDLLYWTGASLFWFSRIYTENQGILRGFLFLGVLLGALLAKSTLGPVFVKISTKILAFPADMAKKIIKRLLFRVKRCKILVSSSAEKGGKCPRKEKKRRKRGRQFEKVSEKKTEKENKI